ncbi:MAG: hypothetical protein Q9196_000445 [Gyalolechia fulgens]
MLPPPVPDAPRRKPRKISRHPDPALQESSTSVDRTSSSKHPRPSDTETSEAEIKRPAARRTRKSEVASVTNFDGSEEKLVRPALEKSPFSDENPFQSGSSPLAPSDNRRRSAVAGIDRKKSRSRRRKTEGITSDAQHRAPQQDGVIVPSSKTFEAPFAQFKKTNDEDEAGCEVEAGEEFTPEEQLELSRDRATNGGLDLRPAPKTKRSSRSNGGSVLKSAPWAVVTVLLSGYALWYRREKLEVGYCGLGQTSDSIAGVRIPDWASVLQPECEPCPRHAICFENLETKCDPDFVLQPHQLSLGGLVPLPPSCEPDGEKARKVKAVRDKAVEELRERNAKSECGTLTDNQGKSVRTPKIEEQELKELVGRQRKKGMSDREFADLWKGAIGDMLVLDEVVRSSDGHRNFLASTSLARITFACSVRRSLRLAVARYRIPIAFLMAITYAAFYARNRIIAARNDTARVPALVSTTLDRLATQAALYNRGDTPESWISIGQLRDDILRDEFSAKRREKLWRRVRDVVEMNANVRASERELRAGDLSRVWEWIGSLLDDAFAEGGRRSGVRFSGNDRRNSLTPDARADVALTNNRHWDEGRPIY